MKPTFQRLAVTLGLFLLCSLVLNLLLIISHFQKNHLIASLSTADTTQVQTLPSSNSNHPHSTVSAPDDSTTATHPSDLQLSDSLQHSGTSQRIKGLDISHFQGTIRWADIKTDGKHFVYIKATESDDFIDDTFKRHWRGALKEDILCGAYHFFHPTVDPEAQARLFIRMVKGYMTDQSLPPVLDVEVNLEKEELTAALYSENVLRWLIAVEKALKRKPVIYTNEHIGNKYLRASALKNYPLYIAYPDPKLKGNAPHLPHTWDTYAFWQYSSKKDPIHGVETQNVDLDIFNGTLEDLKDFIKQTILK